MSRLAKTAFLRSPVILLACGAAITSMAIGEEKVLHTFAKKHLTEQFFSEGSAIGDFNHYGVGDVATGAYWYAGPDYTTKHVIYPPKPFDPNGYSDDFMSFAYDFNGDGRDELKDFVTGKRYWAHGPKGDPEPLAAPVLYWFQLTRSATGVAYIPHLIDNDSGVGTQVTVGDLNGDKHPDILVGNKKGTFVFTHAANTVDAETWRAAQPKPVR
jgi:FG-GAP repeat